MVDFLTNIHKRHLIAHPLGWGMGCLLWIQHLIDMLPQFPVIIYVKSYNIGPSYTGTRLSIGVITQSSMPHYITVRKHGMAFHIAGPFLGETTSYWGIPLTKGAVMQSFDVFFSVRLYKLLNKQWICQCLRHHGAHATWSLIISWNVVMTMSEINQISTEWSPNKMATNL